MPHRYLYAFLVGSSYFKVLAQEHGAYIYERSPLLDVGVMLRDSQHVGMGRRDIARHLSGDMFAHGDYRSKNTREGLNREIASRFGIARVVRQDPMKWVSQEAA